MLAEPRIVHIYHPRNAVQPHCLTVVANRHRNVSPIFFGSKPPFTEHGHDAFGLCRKGDADEHANHYHFSFIKWKNAVRKKLFDTHFTGKCVLP
ncbi:MAG: hypothetical protein D6732_21810 [Methanobacteriota archaeon]|nr:MAG: hypothetical protein D6732_21810 [Euryarchaeota archaeon]